MAQPVDLRRELAAHGAQMPGDLDQHRLDLLRLDTMFGFEIAPAGKVDAAVLDQPIVQVARQGPVFRSWHLPQRRRLDGDSELEPEFAGPGNGQDVWFAMLAYRVALGCGQNRQCHRVGGARHQRGPGEPAKSFAQALAQIGFERTERVRAERLIGAARPAASVSAVVATVL